MPADLLADFDSARHHLEATKAGYEAWARDNCGAKSGGSVSNPTIESELGRWVAFRTQILRGTRPTPPALRTEYGQGLVAVGVLCLNATAPRLQVTITGTARQGQRLTAVVVAA